MAMHGEKPFVHVSDSNGNPYVAAKLYVYEVGTTTLRSIYSDDGLSIAESNPLTSDAAGNFDRFYQNSGTYKLRCETSGGTLIWEEDDIDTGLPAGTGALPISRGGTGATTAAAARAALDVPSNSELSDIAADVADLSTQIQNVVSMPQGYLTLTSLTPIITTDVAAATAVYYTPFVGNLIPIWNGSSFVVDSFAELTLTLNSNHVASTIYDLFVINDEETIRLVTGPAWNNSAAGAGARGAGAGTTELERLNGILVNKNAATMRYGATTVSVVARGGTYVGSMFMDGTNGQVTCHRTSGQSRKWGLWNNYHRKPITLIVSDSTATWAYSTNTIRQSRADATNTMALFTGLTETGFRAVFSQHITNASAGAAATIGFGVNSTTAFSGKTGKQAANTGTIGGDAQAVYLRPPGLLGMTNLNLLETGNGTATTTFNGGDLMQATVDWLG